MVSLLDSMKSVQLVEGSLGTVEENAGVGAVNGGIIVGEGYAYFNIEHAGQ